MGDSQPWWDRQAEETQTIILSHELGGGGVGGPAGTLHHFLMEPVAHRSVEMG